MSETMTGKERREKAQGKRAEILQGRLRDTDPGLARYADDFIFGDVWARPGISHEERMLVAIAVLAAGGHTELLRNYLHGALQDGISPRKLHEVLVMLCVYVGFPPTVPAVGELRRVFAKAVEMGVCDADALDGLEELG